MIQPTNPQAYPQQGGANAVSINIYNPQAYGAAPQQAPYNVANPLYQMPQASLYNQPMVNPQQGYYQQFIPMQTPFMPMQPPMMQPQIVQQQYPELMQPQIIQQQYPQVEPQVVAPAPQAMPDSVMAPQMQEAQPAVEIQQQPAQAPAETVDVETLVQGLNSTDADQRADAINKIAVYAQEAPEVALQVVAEPIMNSLVGIIKEDTSALEGPTDKQIEIAEKITKGEELTPEEDALSEQLSPRDKANKNRIFALYTLAMIQKLQRDELNQYIENQKANGEEPIAPLAISDLSGYGDIVNVIKNDARPEVKIAAIQALAYVAEPQEKATVEDVLKTSLESTDDVVKNAALEALEKFAQAPAEQAA